MKKSSRRLIQGTVLLIIIGVAVGAWLLAGPGGTRESLTAPIPVRTVKPVRMDLEDSVAAWGNLQSFNQVSILPKVSGSVTQIFVDVGDEVEEGDILAEIDREAYRLDLNRSEAVRIPALSTWERMDRLYTAGNATRQDWENARASHLAAEAQSAGARLRYDWTRVPAPASGVVLIRHVTEGSLVSPEAGTPLFTIGSLNDLKLNVHLPEAVYPAFAGDVPPVVSLNAEAFPDIPVKGRIQSVAPWVDPATRTFTVTCRINPNADILRPGMLMEARFTVNVRRNVPVVPVSALSRGESFWTVDENGRSLRRELNPIIISGDFVVVPDDWEQDQFIIEGQHFLNGGEDLNILSSKTGGGGE